MSSSAPPDRYDASWHQGAAPWLGLPTIARKRRECAEPSRFEETSFAVATEVERWRAQFSGWGSAVEQPASGTSVPPSLGLALSNAGLMGIDSVAGLVAITRFHTWTFVADEMFDSRQLDRVDVEALIDDCLGVVLDPSGRAGTSLGQALVECRDGLAEFPLFERFAAPWRTALTRTFAGVREEQRWRVMAPGASARPNLREYLRHGEDCVYLPACAWAAFALLGDISATERASLLEPLVRTAARCVRLSNDAASQHRDAAEGTVSSLWMITEAMEARGSARADALQAATTMIWRRVERSCARLGTAADRPSTVSGRPETWLVDCARHAAELYSSPEFRH